jgi:hypothetical protein
VRSVAESCTPFNRQAVEGSVDARDADGAQAPAVPVAGFKARRAIVVGHVDITKVFRNPNEAVMTSHALEP